MTVIEIEYVIVCYRMGDADSRRKPCFSTIAHEFKCLFHEQFPSLVRDSNSIWIGDSLFHIFSGKPVVVAEPEVCCHPFKNDPVLNVEGTE